jgi:hypothetical protein
MRPGVHIVRARITFVAGSRTSAKTRTVRFDRCAPRVVAPRFTG